MDNTPNTPTEAVTPEGNFWGEHRLAVLMGATVVIAIALTAVSMAFYNMSGAAQLDLSRPGFQSVSSQVDTEPQIDSYSAFGSVNKETIQEFMTLYDKQAEKAKAVDAFNGDPLNPEVLIPSTTE